MFYRGNVLGGKWGIGPLNVSDIIYPYKITSVFGALCIFHQKMRNFAHVYMKDFIRNLRMRKFNTLNFPMIYIIVSLKDTENKLYS